MTQPAVPPPPNRLSAGRFRATRVRSGLRRAGVFGGGVVAALVAILLYGALVPQHPLTSSDVADEIASALASVTPAPPDSEVAYQAIAQSFVIVETATAPDASASPATVPAPAPSGATGTLGSGVVVDAAGDVLTALHVVAHAGAIRLTFADGSQSPATVVSQQPDHDIAVLRPVQLPATLVPATLGNPRSVQIGDEAYLVGNPFGLSGSLSAGVVSGLGRSYRMPGTNQQISGLIQVDAAVNPGNSGGPLINRDGQVVGIVTALVNPSGADVFAGIGLAVPIDIAGGAAGLPPD
jgi:S1-C subfamily serine protease